MPASSRGPLPAANFAPFASFARCTFGAVRSATGTGVGVVVVGAGLGAAPGLVVPQVPSSPAWTQTLSALERIAFGAVAFRLCVPVAEKVTLAVPSAPVSAPPTVAPACGAPVPASVTFTDTGAPLSALAGPVSARAFSLPVATASRTRSPSWTFVLHTPALANAPLTQKAPERRVDVEVGGLAVDRVDAEVVEAREPRPLPRERRGCGRGGERTARGRRGRPADSVVSQVCAPLPSLPSTVRTSTVTGAS